MGHLRHIEAESEAGPVEPVEIDPARLQRIVARDRLSTRPAEQDGDEDEMPVQVAGGRVVEGVHRREHAKRLGGNAGFLGQFSGRGVEQGFAVVDLSARKPPASCVRWICAAHQKHLSVADDGGDDRRDRAWVGR